MPPVILRLSHFGTLLFILLSLVVGHVCSGLLKSPKHRVPKRRLIEYKPFGFTIVYLLTQNKVIGSFESFYENVKELNPSCRIILTVSPVRHIKDSLELNSVSKSILRLCCHTLSEVFPDVVYFPAYEIMLDDLRDYRFYKQDMIHPSEQAGDYIWEKFGDTFFSSETRQFVQDWNKIRAALNHRPFHPAGVGHQQFLQEVLERLKQLESKVDVGGEIEILKKQFRKNRD